MTRGLIGVIVPVYKVEKYIAECIDSILAQTYTNFRLILVDDGTPDNAGKICDEYAKKDSRITVIHQENAGVTRARARGVEEANDCEFITFVDGDDKLLEDALNEYSNRMDSNTDIVIGRTYNTEENKNIEISPFHKFRVPYEDITTFRGMMISLKGGMPWGRLFRRSLLTHYVFDVTRDIFYGEDAIMNVRIAFNTQKDIAVIEKPLYFYRQNINGVCSSFQHTYIYENRLREYILTSIPKEEFRKYAHYYIWRRVWLWTTIFNQQIKCPDWANTEFHKTLIQEIKEFEYPIKKTDWLLIKHTNPYIRLIIIIYREFLVLLYKIIGKNS